MFTLAFVAALALPVSALATTKASTAFRPINNFYRIPNGSAETSVTGRLIYSKMVRSGSRYVRVGGGLKGTVYLFWFNRTTRHYQSVASTVSAPTGFFSLPATQVGDYYVLFKGSRLRHWVANLEEAHDAVVDETDEVTYRIWRLYMAGSAHNFDAGRLNVFQPLLHRPCGGPACLPPSREDWYAASPLK